MELKIKSKLPSRRVPFECTHPNRLLYVCLSMAHETIPAKKLLSQRQSKGIQGGFKNPGQHVERSHLRVPYANVLRPVRKLPGSNLAHRLSKSATTNASFLDLQNVELDSKPLLGIRWTDWGRESSPQGGRFVEISAAFSDAIPASDRGHKASVKPS